MKESVEQSTRLLNEYRAETTSLKLELESLMARRTLGSKENIESEATAAQLKPTFSSAMANLETESTAVQLDLPISAAVSYPEAGSMAEAGTAVSEGAIAVEKAKVPSVESIGANEDFSFVEDILAVILENSTTLVDSDVSRTSVGDRSENTLAVNADVSSRDFEDEREPVCLFILCCHVRSHIFSLLSCNLFRHA